jgi:hypothetical protein
MKSTIRRSIEAVLSLACVALIVLLVVPWPPYHSAPGPVPPVDPYSPTQRATEAALKPLSAEIVLTLFMPRAAARQVKSSALPEQHAEEVSWLRYLGFATSVNGTSRWYVKDTRTGRIITLSLGTQAGGWSLVDVAQERLIIRKGTDLYAVPRRSQ